MPQPRALRHAGRVEAVEALGDGANDAGHVPALAPHEPHERRAAPPRCSTAEFSASCHSGRVRARTSTTGAPGVGARSMSKSRSTVSSVRPPPVRCSGSSARPAPVRRPGADPRGRTPASRVDLEGLGVEQAVDADSGVLDDESDALHQRPRCSRVEPAHPLTVGAVEGDGQPALLARRRAATATARCVPPSSEPPDAGPRTEAGPPRSNWVWSSTASRHQLRPSSEVPAPGAATDTTLRPVAPAGGSGGAGHEPVQGRGDGARSVPGARRAARSVDPASGHSWIDGSLRRDCGQPGEAGAAVAGVGHVAATTEAGSIEGHSPGVGPAAGSAGHSGRAGPVAGASDQARGSSALRPTCGQPARLVVASAASGQSARVRRLRPIPGPVRRPGAG